MVQGNDAKIIWMGCITCNHGALFKIQNWPFAGLFLTIGLTTEAVNSFFCI